MTWWDHRVAQTQESGGYRMSLLSVLEPQFLSSVLGGYAAELWRDDMLNTGGACHRHAILPGGKSGLTVQVFWCYEVNENDRLQVKFLLQFLFVEFRSWRYQSTDFSLSPVSCNQLNPKIRREYSILQKKRYDLSRGCRHCFIFLTFTISSSVKILLWQALPASNALLASICAPRFNACFGHRRAFWTLIQGFDTPVGISKPTGFDTCFRAALSERAGVCSAYTGCWLAPESGTGLQLPSDALPGQLCCSWILQYLGIL